MFALKVNVSIGMFYYLHIILFSKHKIHCLISTSPRYPDNNILRIGLRHNDP